MRLMQFFIFSLVFWNFHCGLFQSVACLYYNKLCQNQIKAVINYFSEGMYSYKTSAFASYCFMSNAFSLVK
jgi:hypothetical protein